MEKDIKIENLNINVDNKILLENTSLIISHSRKYGLIGNNGSGKSTLLKNIVDKKIKIPDKMDIYYVDQEIDVSDDKTVLEMVLESNYKRHNTETKIKEYEKQLETIDINSDEYSIINSNIEELETNWFVNEWDKDPSLIKKILHGLGFNENEQNKPTSLFSGGWRMRISLARALYLKPELLLLDEPTNHLDLDAVIWLTNYLSEWKNTLVVVSHNLHFINNICTDIIYLDHNTKKLNYYSGNYTNFINMLDQQMKHNEKEWRKLEKEINSMKKKSINKKLINDHIKKKELEGIKKPCKPYIINFEIPEVEYVESPLIELNDVSFGYNENNLFENISLSIDMNTRMCIVGKNGVGKSTLLKLISKTIHNSDNRIYHNRRMRLSYFHQHSKDNLPDDLTPIEYLTSYEIEHQNIRKILGKLGVPSLMHKTKIKYLSGGQKSRIVFSSIILQKPHIILLDEPTNHLDIDTIRALIDGLNEYNGGVIIITHEITLIKNINNIILLELENKKLKEINYNDYEEKIIN